MSNRVTAATLNGLTANGDTATAALTTPATVPFPEADPATKLLPPSLILVSATGPWLLRVDLSRDRITLEGHGTTASVFPIRAWPTCSCREWQGNRAFGRECVHVRLLRAVGLVPPPPESGRAG